MQLFEGYVAESKPKPNTVQEWRAVIRHFIDFIGHDDASKITSKDVVSWKDRLLTLPNRRGKIVSARTVRNGYSAMRRRSQGPWFSSDGVQPAQNESGRWHPDAIERQLGHIEGNHVRAAYARGEHWDERVAMMQWWADHLDELRSSV